MYLHRSLAHTLEGKVGAERTAGEERRAHGLQTELPGIPGGWFPTGNIATDQREGGRRGGPLGTLLGLGSASSRACLPSPAASARQLPFTAQSLNWCLTTSPPSHLVMG